LKESNADLGTTVDAEQQPLSAILKQLEPLLAVGPVDLDPKVKMAVQLLVPLDCEPLPNLEPPQQVTARRDLSAAEVKSMTTRLEQPIEQMDQIGLCCGDSRPASAAAFNIQPSDELNEEQNAVLNQIATWIQSRLADNSTVPLRLFMHGQAGTGKSFLVRELVSRGQEANALIACCAPTALAATALPRGRTIHALAAIAAEDERQPSPSNIEVARRYLADAVLIVLDEVSAVSERVFHALAARLRSWFPRVNGDPFGNIGLLLIGDMFQQAPVGRSLMAAADRPLANFRTCQLKQQMRCAQDAEWATMLDRLRDISQQYPVAFARLFDLLKPFSAVDVQRDPEWRSAVVLTSTNAVRHAVNEAQIKRFALRTRQPIVQWTYRLTLDAAASQSGVASSVLLSTSGITHWFHC